MFTAESLATLNITHVRNVFEENAVFIEQTPAVDLGTFSLKRLAEVIKEEASPEDFLLPFHGLGSVVVASEGKWVRDGFPKFLKPGAQRCVSDAVKLLPTLAKHFEQHYSLTNGYIHFEKLDPDDDEIPHIDDIDQPNRIAVVAGFPHNTEFVKAGKRWPGGWVSDITNKGPLGDLTPEARALIEPDDWETVEEHAIAFSTVGTIHRRPTMPQPNDFDVRAFLRLNFYPKPDSKVVRMFK